MISPVSSLAACSRQARSISRRLAAQLDDEGKTLLHRLSDAENEASSTIALENFSLRFHLGMRLAVEGLLGGGDGCLADIYGDG